MTASPPAPVSPLLRALLDVREIRHLPDGRGRHPTPRLRRHTDYDQRPARAAIRNSVRMTGTAPKSVISNADDGTGAPEPGEATSLTDETTDLAALRAQVQHPKRTTGPKKLGKPLLVPVASCKASRMGNAG